MEHMTVEEKDRLIEAFKSVIRKSEKALSHMKTDSPQTKLLEKRMKAAQIGLDILLARWEDRVLDISLSDLIEARKELASLLLTLPTFLEKLKEGSGQRTYIISRIKAFEVAISYMDDWIKDRENQL